MAFSGRLSQAKHSAVTGGQHGKGLAGVRWVGTALRIGDALCSSGLPHSCLLTLADPTEFKWASPLACKSYLLQALMNGCLPPLACPHWPAHTGLLHWPAAEVLPPIWRLGPRRQRHGRQLLAGVGQLQGCAPADGDAPPSREEGGEDMCATATATATPRPNKCLVGGAVLMML